MRWLGRCERGWDSARSSGVGESPADEAIEAHVHHGCMYERRRWVIYVCAVVLSDLYIVNKSNAPRDEWGVTEQKNERALCCGGGWV